MNYSKELTKVMTCFNYRGVLVWKIIGGFEYAGKKYKSLEEIDDAIDSSHKSIEKSIVVENKTGSINCQNENL